MRGAAGGTAASEPRQLRREDHFVGVKGEAAARGRPLNCSAAGALGETKREAKD